MKNYVKVSAVAALLVSALVMPAQAGWLKASGGSVPQGTVSNGAEANGQKLYVCTAKFAGGYHPGKVRQAFGGCNVPYGGKEHKVSEYWVITKPNNYTWSAARNDIIPLGAVVGGNETDGKLLFFCRAKYQGGVHGGKVRRAFGGCNIAYGGREIMVPSYEVMTIR